MTFLKTHKALSAQTVSRLMLEVLGQTGIDTKTFSVHSNRPALSTSAKAGGASMGENIKRRFGSNRTTFEKFYHKETLVHNSNFEERLVQQ